MTDEQAFLNKIAENPLDEGPRGAFADWLDEHDRPEEADRQRKWVKVYKWFQEFASDHCSGYHSDLHRREYTAEEMIQAGTAWADSFSEEEFDNGEKYPSGNWFTQ
jgi:uncharacterized protein (TIGR02996 family)